MLVDIWLKHCFWQHCTMIFVYKHFKLFMPIFLGFNMSGPLGITVHLLWVIWIHCVEHVNIICRWYSSLSMISLGQQFLLSRTWRSKKKLFGPENVISSPPLKIWLPISNYIHYFKMCWWAPLGSEHLCKFIPLLDGSM